MSSNKNETTKTAIADNDDADEIQQEEEDKHDAHPSVFPTDTDASIEEYLFDPDRKQKPSLWNHIKLIAPGPANNPPPGQLKWRSKDAVAVSTHTVHYLYSLAKQQLWRPYLFLSQYIYYCIGLLFEMQKTIYVHPRYEQNCFTPHDVISWSTRNPGQACCQTTQLGRR
jgi:hypothetical protein